MSRSHGGQRAYFYGCSANHKRGMTICDNNLVMRTSPIDEAVLEALGGKVLRPAVVMAVIEGVLAEMTPKAMTRTVDTLKSQIAEADRALANLSRAIAEGGALDAPWPN